MRTGRVAGVVLALAALLLLAGGCSRPESPRVTVRWLIARDLTPP